MMVSDSQLSQHGRIQGFLPCWWGFGAHLGSGKIQVIRVTILYQVTGVTIFYQIPQSFFLENKVVGGVQSLTGRGQVFHKLFVPTLQLKNDNVLKISNNSLRNTKHMIQFVFRFITCINTDCTRGHTLTDLLQYIQEQLPVASWLVHYGKNISQTLSDKQELFFAKKPMENKNLIA